MVIIYESSSVWAEQARAKCRASSGAEVAKHETIAWPEWCSNQPMTLNLPPPPSPATHSPLCFALNSEG